VMAAAACSAHLAHAGRVQAAAKRSKRQAARAALRARSQRAGAGLAAEAKALRAESHRQQKAQGASVVCAVTQQRVFERLEREARICEQLEAAQDRAVVRARAVRANGYTQEVHQRLLARADAARARVLCAKHDREDRQERAGPPGGVCGAAIAAEVDKLPCPCTVIVTAAENAQAEVRHSSACADDCSQPCSDTCLVI
jgi:hypothetical protein